MAEAGNAQRVVVSKRMILVHTVGILLLIISGLGTLLVTTKRFNDLQRDASQVMVETQISALRDKTETFVRDYSVWDEAFEAFRTDDVDWIYRNIGTAATDIGALDLIVMLDQKGGKTLRWVEGSAPDGSAAPVAPEVIDEILARRPSDPADVEWTTSMVRMVGGVPWIFAATTVRPIEIAQGALTFADLPIQIHGVEIGPAILAEMAAPILVEDLHAVTGAPEGEAFAPFGNSNGDDSVGLAWTPPAIGAQILASIFWPLFIAMVLISVIGAFVSLYMVRSARALERALVDAKAADRLKSEFLSNISHELKTPMNGIIGSVQLLEMTELDEEQAELLSMLSASADLQDSLVSDLLAITQIEDGSRRTRSEPFVPADIVSEAAGMFRKAAGDKGLDLTCDITDEVRCLANGDSRSLRQIVINLVGNAVKFTEEGSITVSATGDVADDRMQLKISVTDTGPGIADAEIERIFDRFYQIDGSITRKKDGAGLGLSISRDLARQMDGEILVSQNPAGQGSVFTLFVSLDRRNIAVTEEAA
jgi:signal transduction histidine kinase